MNRVKFSKICALTVVSLGLVIISVISIGNEKGSSSNKEETSISTVGEIKKISTNEEAENNTTKSIEESIFQVVTEVTTEEISEPTEETRKSRKKVKKSADTYVAVTEPTEEVKSKVEPIQQSDKSSPQYLLSISKVDPGYTPKAFSLSNSEKYDIACVVMGEFGGGGFTGCALIAQAVRDAMQTYGYSANDALVNMGYYGYNGSPNSDSYDAIDYIFSGNAAVQHRILYMNNTYSAWHESQNFICEYQGVRFFDAW